MRVLVTDGSYEQTLAIVRYLGRLGVEVCVIAESVKAEYGQRLGLTGL